jgi:N-carbamoylputrescine amidase
MTNHIIACAVQQPCNRGRAINFAYSLEQIAAATARGANLVVLPELHLDHYFCQNEDTASFDLAQAIPGPTCEQLSQAAKQHQTVIVSTLFEKRAPGLYHNTAVVFDRDGGLAGVFRKMHIPDDPGFYEKFYFTPGDLGFKPITTSLGKLGVLICWDQWYPEAARLMALAGAEVLIYPTAIGWNPLDDNAEKQRQLDAWRTIQRGHAIANGIPVIACNRIGFEAAPDHGDGIDFWGNSFIAGPQGEILASANHEEDTLLIAELHRQRSEDVRRIWPFFRDRRIDYFQDLTRRYID